MLVNLIREIIEGSGAFFRPFGGCASSKIAAKEYGGNTMEGE